MKISYSCVYYFIQTRRWAIFICTWGMIITILTWFHDSVLAENISWAHHLSVIAQSAAQIWRLNVLHNNETLSTDQDGLFNSMSTAQKAITIAYSCVHKMQLLIANKIGIFVLISTLAINDPVNDLIASIEKGKLFQLFVNSRSKIVTAKLYFVCNQLTAVFLSPNFLLVLWLG